MLIKERIRKYTMILLCVLLLVPGFSTVNIANVHAEDNIDREETVPLFANRVVNPELKYDGLSGISGAYRIPEWKIAMANDVLAGEDIGDGYIRNSSGNRFKSLTTRPTLSATHSHYQLWHENKGDNQIFRGQSKVVKANDQTGSDGRNTIEQGWAYYSVNQTVTLDKGETYIFRMDADTTSEANYIVRLYRGTLSSGNDYVGYELPKTLEKGPDGVQHVEIELPADRVDEQGRATISIRHVPKRGTNGEFHIYRVGFYLKADYELQNMVHDLFSDAAQTQLAYKGDTVAEAIQYLEDLMTRIEAKRDDGTDYHQDVRNYINDALDQAKALLIPVVEAKAAIDHAFENRPIDEERFIQLQEQVNEITSDNFREALTEHIELTKKKQETLDALVQEGQDKIDEVKHTEGLSEEEKAEEVKRIENAVEDAKNAVEKAEKSTEVDQALKDLAKEELKIKAALTEKLIDKLADVSEDERDKAKADLANILADALDEVDAAKGKDTIDTAVTDGKVAIDAVYDALKETNTSVKAAKKDAKESLEQEADVAKSVVNELEALSKEEKDAIKDQIDRALNNAKEKIDEATSTNAVENAKNDGSLAIEKEKAKAEIDAAESLALDALKDLNLGDDLTKKEQAVKDTAADARQDIDEARSKEGVQTEVQIGKDDLADILKDAQLIDIKNKAKEGVETAAQDTIDVIEAKEDLRRAEKDALIAEVKAAKDTAITGIDNANAETSVNGAVTVAEAKFDLTLEKADAIESLKAEAKKVKASVEKTDGLTESEIEAALLAVDTNVQDAIDQVLEAENKQAVDKAVDKGMLDMHKIDAKAGMDAHRNNGLASLESLKSLTEEEKTDLASRIEEARSDAINNIDEASSKDAASNAVHSGKTAIDNLLVEANLLHAKNKAKSDITAAEQAAKDAIDAMPHLSAEEKAAAKQQATSAADEAQNAIGEAASTNGVHEEKITGLEALDKVEKNAQFSNDKNGATKELQAAKNQYVDEITGIRGVDSAKKDEAKDELETILTEAIATLEDAKNKADLNEVVTRGKADMKEVVDALRDQGSSNIEHAKGNASDALKSEAETAKQAIDALPNVSEEKKQAIKDQVDENLNIALEQIDQAEDLLTVEKEKNKGSITIEQEKLKADIDNLADLTKVEKDAAQMAIDEAATTAQMAIDSATNIEEAKAVASTGKNDMRDIVNNAKLQDAKNGALTDLDKAARAAKEAIEAMENLSTDEKPGFIEAIDNAIAYAKDTVNDAQSTADVTSALNDGKSNFNDIVADAALRDAKNAAIENLEAQNEKWGDKRLDRDLPQLTEEEKTAAITDLNKILEDAIQEIETATNSTEITSAEDTGLENLQNRYNLAAAQNEIRSYAESTNTSIDHLKGVNQTEKNTAKAEVDQIREDALVALQTSDDRSALVDKAKKDMDEVFDRVIKASDENIENAKNNAKADLSIEAQHAIDEINALGHLSEEAKQEAINNINKAKADGETAIDATDSPNAATTVKNEVVEIFNGIVEEATLADAKLGAENALDAKETGLFLAIDALTEIDKTVKGEAKAAITAAKEEAIEKVKDARKLANVVNEETKGKTAMQEIYDALLAENDGIIREAIDKATTDLEADAAAKKAVIDQLAHLGDRAKETAKAAIDQALTDAKTTIADAENTETIRSATSTFNTRTDDVVKKAKLDDAKVKANTDLMEHAQFVKNKIDALADVSEKQKVDAKQAVEAALAAALNHAENANTIEAVTEAVNNGKSAMDAIYDGIEADNTGNVNTAKEKAIEELERVANEQKTDIDVLSHLTSDQKVSAKAAVDNEKDEGIYAVNNAETVESITIAKDTAIEQMKAERKVAELLNTKNKANTALEAKATSLIDAIGNLTGVEQAIKDQAIADINHALASAKTTVAEAETVETVEASETDGKQAMQDIFDQIKGEDDNIIDDAKSVAKGELEREANDAKAAIDGLSHLSNDEKLAAKAKVDTAKTKGESAIDAADAPTAITNAKDAAIEEMKEAVKAAQLLNAKHHSNAELDAHAQATKDAIDTLTGIPAAEKETAKAAVDTALTNAKAAVNNEMTIEGVDAQETAGKQAIDNIFNSLEAKNEENLNKAKESAKDELQHEADKQKEIIDRLPDLTDQQKQVAKEKIDQAVNVGKENIDKATSPEDITAAKKDALDKIEEEVAKAKLQDAKNAAEKALNEKAQSTKDAIDQLTGVDEAAQNTAKEMVDQALADALHQVKDAQNIAAVEEAVSKGKTAMDDIYDDLLAENNTILENAKNAAKDELDNAAEDAKNAIDALPNLSDGDKKAAKAAIDQAAEAGKSAIETGTSPTDITDKKNDAISKIDTIVDGAKLADDKLGAIKELEQKAQSIKDAIDQLTSLKDEEKAAAKKEIDDALAAAKDAVNSATNKAAVDEATKAGKDKMDEIYNHYMTNNNANLNAAKDRAEKALEDDAAKGKESIDNLSNLSKEEKDAAKDAIDDAVEKGKEAIQQASSPDEITNAKNEASDHITSIVKDATLTDAQKGAKDALDNAATDAKEAIDNLSNLSEEEKNAAKDAVDQATKAGKNAIDGAKTPEEVNETKQDTLTNIDKIFDDAQLADAKQGAREELQAKADDLKDKIDQLTGVSQAEKDAAKDAIDEAVNEARKGIQDAKDLPAVEDALNKGKTQLDEIFNAIEVENLENLEQSKDKAKDELDKEAEDAKNEIDNLPNLTDDEKQAAKDAVDEAIQQGKDKIDKAKSPEDITDEKNKVINQIDQEVDKGKLQDAKNAAVSELEGKSQSTKEAIDKLTGVSKEEKDAAKKSLDEALADALKAVQDAKDIPTVNKAVADGKASMDAIYDGIAKESETNLEQSKDKAKDELGKEAEDAKQEIDNLPNLTDDEKQAAKDAIDQAVQEGKDKINNSKSPEDITDEKNKVIDQIDQEVDKAKLQDAKNAAVEKLEEKAQSTKEAIDQLTGVSKEEKDAAKKAVDEALENALKAVQDAKDISAVNKAVSDGKAAMDAIYDNIKTEDEEIIDQMKDAAKSELDQLAKDEKDEIDNLPNLTEEEKQSAKDAIDEAVKQGKDKIDKATSPEEVTKEKNETIDKVEKEVEKAKIQDAKNAAVEELEEKAQSTKDAIDQLTGVSKKEKDAAKKAVDEALADALNAIQKAKDIPGVDKAVADGKSAMDAIYDGIATESETNLEQSKDKAKDELDKEAEDAKQEINNLPNLTDEEKQDAKDAIDEAVKQGKDKIDNATSPEDATKEKNETIDKIDREVDKAKLQDAKNAAVTELEAKAQSTKDAIDKLTGVSKKEKDAAKNLVDEALADALKAVQAAKDIPAVNKAVVDGKASMDAIYDGIATESETNLEQSKDKAKDELEKDAEDAKKEIDNLPNLTDQEREAAKDAIDETVKQGKDKIDKATSPEEVTKEKNETIDKVEKEVEKAKLQDAKKAAVEELEAKANSTKDAIDQLTGVSKKEKDTAKKAVDKALADALNAIQKAKDIPGVDKAVADGKSAMDAIYDGIATESKTNLEQSKDKAKDELDKEAEDAKQEIDNLPNLTDKEKDAAKDAIDQAVKDGKDQIDNATSPEDATNEKNNVVDQIDKEVDKAKLQDAKNAAVTELEAKAESMKDAIDQLTGVSKKEKDTAKKAVDEALADALKAVQAAKDIPAVNKAVADGKAAMDVIYDNIAKESSTNLEQSKDKAKDELDKEAEDAKQEIDNLPNLTDEDKQAAKDAINEAVKQGKDKIDKATSPEEVTNEKNNSIDNINKEVEKAKLQDAKNAAVTELEAKAESMKDAIDQLTGVSKKEKDTAKKAVDEALADALKAVQAAKDIPAVNKAVADGKAAMEAIYDNIAKESSTNLKQSKDKAKDELEKEAEDAKQEIDNLPNLTDKEKDVAKDAIDEAVQQGKDKIDNSKSPEDITDEKNKVINQIDQEVDKVKLQDAKNAAVTELEAKAESTKDAIDQLTGVSKKEKDTAKKAVDEALENALKAVQDAKDISTVDKAVADGKASMDAIYDGIATESETNLEQSKDKAKDELEKDAEDAKRKIDQLSNLTDKEKDTAKDAIDETVKDGKDKIDKATSPEDATKEKSETIDKIDREVDKAKLQDAKNAAVAELEAKAKSTKNAIDQLTGVNKKDKDAAKKAVDKALADALKAVQKAKNIPAVNNAVADGKASMDAIYDGVATESSTNLEQSKDKAKDELEQEAEDAKKKIDRLPNLTDQEKQAAKDRIDELVQLGKDAIDQATTPKDVTVEKNSIIKEIQKLVEEAILQNEKAKAKIELEEKADQMKEAIDRLPGIIDEEKNVAKNQLDQILKDVSKEVDDGRELQSIIATIEQGKKELDRIYNELYQDGQQEPEKEQASNEIPKTATRIFNMMLFGSFLFFGGALTLFARRRKQQDNA